MYEGRTRLRGEGLMVWGEGEGEGKSRKKFAIQAVLEQKLEINNKITTKNIRQKPLYKKIVNRKSSKKYKKIEKFSKKINTK